MEFDFPGEAAGVGPLQLGSAGMDRLVHYICTAEGHQQLALFDSASAWAPNVLTFNDGRWSYCPAGERSDHRWQETQPRAYEDVRGEVEQRIRAR
jgi:hypothetical protein